MSLPPAGWYDDPDAPGARRFWDGSAWTQDRHPAPQPAPPPVPAVAADSFVCPVCGRDDKLSNVGALVDEGTTTTRGSSRTIGVGSGTTTGSASDGTIYSGTTSSSYAQTTNHYLVSTSNLASRFRMPAKPRSHFGAWFVLGWLAPAVVIAVLVGPGLANEGETGDLSPAVLTIISIGVTFAFAAAGTWVIGLIVAFVQRAATAASLRARRAQWDAGYWRVRGAYFCGRDGVVTDGVVAQSPEDFVQTTFGT